MEEYSPISTQKKTEQICCGAAIPERDIFIQAGFLAPGDGKANNPMESKIPWSCNIFTLKRIHDPENPRRHQDGK